MLAHYRPGGAFQLALGHRLFCLGCRWAPMLVMFGAGVAVLWWMAALTALMVDEKAGRHGTPAVPIAGTLLLPPPSCSWSTPPGFPTPLQLSATRC